MIIFGKIVLVGLVSCGGHLRWLPDAILNDAHQFNGNEFKTVFIVIFQETIFGSFFY